jgi:hypothetical protein
LCRLGAVAGKGKCATCALAIKIELKKLKRGQKKLKTKRCLLIQCCVRPIYFFHFSRFNQSGKVSSLQVAQPLQITVSGFAFGRV